MITQFDCMQATACRAHERCGVHGRCSKHRDMMRLPPCLRQCDNAPSLQGGSACACQACRWPWLAGFLLWAMIDQCAGRPLIQVHPPRGADQCRFGDTLQSCSASTAASVASYAVMIGFGACDLGWCYCTIRTARQLRGRLYQRFRLTNQHFQLTVCSGSMRAVAAALLHASQCFVLLHARHARARASLSLSSLPLRKASMSVALSL